MSEHKSNTLPKPVVPSSEAAEDESAARDTHSSGDPVYGSSALANARRELFAYVRTPRFYLVLFMGQVLSLCITGTNILSGLLASKGTSIPAFQSFFNFVLLNAVFTSYTLYQAGPRGYWQMLRTRGWKYLILAFLDVEGNYFAVLAFRYTTVISAQLINFWAIVVVVILSFFLLRVRYHWTQIVGILVCCGGMGLLLARDAQNGSSVGGSIPTELKGDLFMLLGASFYGIANVAEEFLVSTAPLYEVVGQIGLWATLISGAQAAIFDRQSFRNATWTPEVGGYLTGFTLLMFLFYSAMPVQLRLSSAAFFNISLLTSNFYGVVIGIRVFGYVFDHFYPLAFAMILFGLCLYFAYISVFGEAKKPWLGENQEGGVVGVGTAKRMATEQAQGGIGIV